MQRILAFLLLAGVCGPASAQNTTATVVGDEPTAGPFPLGEVATPPESIEEAVPGTEVSGETASPVAPSDSSNVTFGGLVAGVLQSPAAQAQSGSPFPLPCLLSCLSCIVQSSGRAYAGAHQHQHDPPLTYTVFLTADLPTTVQNCAQYMGSQRPNETDYYCDKFKKTCEKSQGQIPVLYEGTTRDDTQETPEEPIMDVSLAACIAQCTVARDCNYVTYKIATSTSSECVLSLLATIGAHAFSVASRECPQFIANSCVHWYLDRYDDRAHVLSVYSLFSEHLCMCDAVCVWGGG